MENQEHTNSSEEQAEDEKFVTLLASIIVGFFFDTYQHEEGNSIFENIE
ncbi:hypothetical protein [Dyadobacter frigoris]|nr:hypothetical protein [Dyadobacter frigoris]GLU56184.1 hypothetical protein Dfri01_56450 [Dyadobacter frigoris]